MGIILVNNQVQRDIDSFQLAENWRFFPDLEQKLVSLL